MTEIKNIGQIMERLQEERQQGNDSSADQLFLLQWHIKQ